MWGPRQFCLLALLASLAWQHVHGLSVLPSVGCGPVCRIGCPFGNVLDERGCPTCQCKPGMLPPPDFNRCPQIQCPICPGGFKYTTDEKGCNFCSCKESALGPTTPPASMTCPEFRCPDCPGPLQISADSAGCSVCTCRTPTASGPTPLPPDVNRCPQVQCPVCPQGIDFTTDARGCNFCSCKSSPAALATPPPDFNRCPQIQCPICPGGFKYTTDEKGCNFCSCRDTLPAPVPPSSQPGGLQCGPVCLIFCQHGNVLDARGCPTCQCRQPPPPRCLQPKETGLCRAAFRHFYYDSQARRCQRFIYGGCGGNQNNFQSLQECQAVCERNQGQANVRPPCPNIRRTCRSRCWLGYQKDANGCEICQCRNMFSGFSGFF